MQPKYQLDPITKDELQGLSNIELCDRMEKTLINILYESYPESIIENFPRESIRDFFHTKTIQRLPLEHQRDALRKCFEYLIQLEYLKRVGGWSNKEVFNESYDEICSWKSPRLQSIHFAIKHIEIVGSSTACERLIDLFHIIGVGEPVKGKKKFSAFSKWLLNPQNKFLIFSPFLPLMSKFRSEKRTAEIHKWSNLPERILLLQKPSHSECNESLELINVLNMIWNPLIKILDEQQLEAIPSICFELHSAILEKNETAVKYQTDKIATDLGISI